MINVLSYNYGAKVSKESETDNLFSEKVCLFAKICLSLHSVDIQ